MVNDCPGHFGHIEVCCQPAAFAVGALFLSLCSPWLSHVLALGLLVTTSVSCSWPNQCSTSAFWVWCTTFFVVYASTVPACCLTRYRPPVPPSACALARPHPFWFISSQNDARVKEALRKANPKKRLAALLKLSKKSCDTTEAPDAQDTDMFDTSSAPTQGRDGCGWPQPTYRREGFNLTIEYVSSRGAAGMGQRRGERLTRIVAPTGTATVWTCRTSGSDPCLQKRYTTCSRTSATRIAACWD